MNGQPLGLPPDAPDEPRVTSANVRWAVAVIERSGLVEWFEERLPRFGRPRTEITVEGLLVCLLLVACEGNGLLLNRVEAMAYRRIPDRWRTKFQTHKPTRTLRERDAAYKNVRDRFHALCAVVDPSPLPKNRRLTPEWQQELAAPLTDEQQAERRAQLDWIVNTIIETSIQMLPPKVLARWKGSVAVDGTKVPAFAIGRSYDGTWESTDPDADWHVRSKEAHALDPGERPGNDSVWGYECTTATMAYDEPLAEPITLEDGTVVPGDPKPHPNIVVRARVHKPSRVPGEQAVHLLRSLSAAGYPANWLGADRAITNGTFDGFHVPVQELGYKIVADYKTEHLGKRGEHHGAHLVDGWWYCPSMPTTLVNATRDYHEGTIDHDTWKARIAERAKFAFRRKELNEVGEPERLYCPAAGPSPTAACPLKPASMRTRTPGQTVAVPDPSLRKRPPKACRQQTITVPADTLLKWRQPVPHGTPEWLARWGTLRNSVEGSNGILKDPNIINLNASRVRRVRGIAAQSLVVAFMIVSANVRLIRTWTQLADESERLPDGAGAPRKKRRGTRHQRDKAAWAAQLAARHDGEPPGDPPPDDATSQDTVNP